MNFAEVKTWTIPEGEVTKVVDSQGRVIWQKESIADRDWFYVENISNTNEILSIAKNDSDAPTLTIEYSTDKTNWNTLGTTSTTALTRTLAPGDKVYLRCNTNRWAGGTLTTYDSMNRIMGVSKVGGNIMSLLYGSNFIGNETALSSANTYCFTGLFNHNSTLKNASDLLLPATTLIYRCYSQMFDTCIALTQGPSLPATTMAYYCYDNMFNDCTSLTQAPALPATTLANGCYNSMFSRCTSLTTAPSLPANTLKPICYRSMFSGCTSLIVPPQRLGSTLGDESESMGCCEFMFSRCTSLTYTPELPAARLKSSCYKGMFNQCEKLSYVRCYANTSSTGHALGTSSWLHGVAATGMFYKSSSGASNFWPRNQNGIPSGWTVYNV